MRISNVGIKEDNLIKEERKIQKDEHKQYFKRRDGPAVLSATKKSQK